VDFIVNPKLLKKPVETAALVFAENNGESMVVTVTARKAKPYNAYLNKTAYTADDAGFIVIENPMGTEIIFDVATDCPYVRIEERYRVREKSAKIPFSVKGGMKAGRDLKRNGYIGGKITLYGNKTHMELAFVIANPI
jgi:hypothetical protein